MALKSIAVPWLGAGLLMLGYAAFSRLRSKYPSRESMQPRRLRAPRPTSGKLTPQSTSDPPPPSGNAPTRRDELGALFLGRASVALSPFGHAPPGAR